MPKILKRVGKTNKHDTLWVAHQKRKQIVTGE